MTNAVTKHVWGQLLEENAGKSGGRLALLLTNPKPEEKTADSLYLRFAFVTLGTEQHLFPAFLLDDWGGEIRSLAVYSWVRENGMQFPRAEIFGFERSGESVQFFVRELEQYAKLPCYVFPNRQASLAEGRQIAAILLPDESVSQPKKIKRPSQLKRPLSSARVSWWQVPDSIDQFDFSILCESA